MRTPHGLESINPRLANTILFPNYKKCLNASNRAIGLTDVGNTFCDLFPLIFPCYCHVPISTNKLYFLINFLLKLLPLSHESCLRFVKIWMYLDNIYYVDTSKFRQISDKFHGTEGVLDINTIIDYAQIISCKFSFIWICN
jgi:hypothetical protein